VKTYAPVIKGNAAVHPVDKAQRIFELMRAHPEQGRVGMVWDATLALCAQAKCQIQAQGGWTGHVDPDGHGPNWFVRRMAYPLPDWYSDTDAANNIESLSHGGDGTPEQTFEGLLNSPLHRIHLLGLDAFYAAQTQVGVGYFAGGEKRFYWCVLSAPPA
jgi:uncharacterized protein YkwD